jgi:hypothetical protein
MEEQQKQKVIKILDRIRESPDDEEHIFLLAFELAKIKKADEGFNHFFIKELEGYDDVAKKLTKYTLTEKWNKFRDDKFKEMKEGEPIVRHGQIRNECWKCGNYPREINPEGEKGYYKCEFCGASMHK